LPIIGVAATVIGFGFFGPSLIFGGGAGGGRLTAASAVDLPASSTSSAGFFTSLEVAGLAAVSLPSPLLLTGSALRPNTSAVVAAAISLAGITSPSSAGAGSLGDSGPAGFFPRPVFAWGTLKSRTVGSGTGFKSAPKPERATCSSSSTFCFCNSRARRSRFCSSADAGLSGRKRAQSLRTHSPN